MKYDMDWYNGLDSGRRRAVNAWVDREGIPDCVGFTPLGAGRVRVECLAYRDGRPYLDSSGGFALERRTVKVSSPPPI